MKISTGLTYYCLVEDNDVYPNKYYYTTNWYDEVLMYADIIWVQTPGFNVYYIKHKRDRVHLDIRDIPIELEEFFLVKMNAVEV